MSDRSESFIEDGTGSWILGGAISGGIGSLVFGLLLWLADPEIITDAIPAIYGLEPIGTAGWIFHLAHGLVLGVVFGFLVSRRPILGTLTADVETGFLAATGPRLRFVLAGFVYGLAVWTILPLVVPILSSFGGVDDPGFPIVAFEGLAGHALYGLFLGVVFAIVADVASEADGADAPFREVTDDAETGRESER